MLRDFGFIEYNCKIIWVSKFIAMLLYYSKFYSLWSGTCKLAVLLVYYLF